MEEPDEILMGRMKENILVTAFALGMTVLTIHKRYSIMGFVTRFP